MFICDCHCDTLTELYKKGTSLYDNDQHFDIKRQIELGGGLQFCAIFVPTHEFRYYGGLRYTLSLLDKYKQELKTLQDKGIDVLPVLTKADAADVLNHKAATLLAIEEGGAIDGSLEALRMLYELGVRAMTLAAKSLLRVGCPVVIAVSTNDGLGASGENIARLYQRKHYYFVPYGQDDPNTKPQSLKARFELLPQTLEAALEGRQLQPVLQCPCG